MNLNKNNHASKTSGMTDAASPLRTSAADGARGSLNALQRQANTGKLAGKKPGNEQDFQQGVKKMPDDQPAKWWNQDGTMTEAEIAADMNATQVAAADSIATGTANAGTANPALSGDAGTALAGKTGESAGMAAGTGSSAAGGAASGSTAGAFWATTSGKVATVAGGVLVAAVAASSGGGGDGGSSDASNAQGAGNTGTTGSTDLPKPDTENNGEQKPPAETPAAPTNEQPANQQPPSAPQSQPQPNASQAVAHDATTKLAASLFTDASTGKAPGAIKIITVTVSSPTDDLPALLLHAGTPQETPLLPGSLIDSSMLGEISWKAGNNSGGSFSYVAADINSGNPIAGAAEQTVNINEHRAAPNYPSDGKNDTDVAHDADTPIAPYIFTGTSPDANNPHPIRILEIKPSGANATGGLMVDRDGTGPNPAEAVKANETIQWADIDKLSWNSTGNEGGTITFEALTLGGMRILGSEVQTLNITEHRAAPTYASQTETVSVDRNGSKLLDAALFNGTGTAPEAIVITGLSNNGTPQGTHRALILNKGEAGEKVLTAAGPDSVVLAADFGKITWDASVADGGFFQFKPALANGTEIAGAAEQKVNITEVQPVPAYPTSPNDVAIRHDGVDEIGPYIFQGEKADRAPTHVKITAITPTGGTGTPLMLDTDGAGTAATPQAVQQDQLIDISVLTGGGKLTWDTTGNSGGSIRFMPVLADGTPIQGATEQSVNIVEHPAPPTYANQNETVDVPRDGTKLLDAALFNGTGTPPEAIVITGISNSSTTPGGKADTPPVLIYDKGGADEHIVASGETIMRANFGKLTWDAAAFENGYFDFTPALADGTLIEDATEQRITVNEQPVTKTAGIQTPDATQESQHSELVPINKEVPEDMDSTETASPDAGSATANVLTPADLLDGGAAAASAPSVGTGPVDAGSRWAYTSPTLLDDNQQILPTV
ncbi:MAG: hypothetical protein Q4D19_07920 [Lautropia sp.]|nr:hypothetical protein [Lautropia sp.]